MRAKLLSFLCFILGPSLSAAGGLSLSGALERALENDPLLRGLEALLEADLEDSELLRATRRPSLDAFGSASGNYNRSDSAFFGARSESFPSYRLGLEGRQPVYRRDWANRAERARRVEDRARALHEADLQAYFYELSARYIDTLVSQENLKLARIEAEAVRESLRDTRSRYETETIAATDLYEAEARDDLAQARLLSAEQATEDARERLEEATGPVDALPRLSEEAELDRFLEGDVEHWTKRAIESSPAVKAAHAAYEVAAGEIEARRADRAPTVDLVGQVTRSDTSESSIGDRGTDARVGLEVNVPIFRGRSLDAAERQAQARHRAAGHELDRLQRELRWRTRDAWRAIEVAGREVAAFRAAVRSAEAAEAATQNGFEAGTRTILDVMNARSATVEARRDLSNARHALVLAQLRLYQVAGELTEDKLRRLDALFR